MDSFTADTTLSETIIVKRNAAGHIVVIHSDWHATDLVDCRISTAWKRYSAYLRESAGQKCKDVIPTS